MAQNLDWDRLEASFVAAIPQQLLREANEAEIGAYSLIDYLVSRTEYLHHHTAESKECLNRMVMWLEQRMERIRCWSLSRLLFEEEDARRDPHVSNCGMCQSKLGWLKSQLSFKTEYIWLKPDEL